MTCRGRSLGFSRQIGSYENDYACLCACVSLNGGEITLLSQGWAGVSFVFLVWLGDPFVLSLDQIERYASRIEEGEKLPAVHWHLNVCSVSSGRG